jgi:dUTP pyrophosphatase
MSSKKKHSSAFDGQPKPPDNEPKESGFGSPDLKTLVTRTKPGFGGQPVAPRCGTCNAPFITEDAMRRHEASVHGTGNAKAAATSVAAQPLKLYVKKLSTSAVIPVRGSAGAAGYDLFSAYKCTVKARGKELVKTDLSIAVPEGTYGRIAPRSGLAWKNSIDVGAGVVDADYRGNIGIILFNHSDVDFEIIPGDRVAQLILERIAIAEVSEVDDLDCTSRGAGGFGSSGVSGAPTPAAAAPSPSAKKHKLDDGKASS